MTVPYNLRPLDGPLPRELGNRFGLVYLTLPPGIADPAERLAEVHRRMDAIKHSREGGLSSAILEAVGRTRTRSNKACSTCSTRRPAPCCPTPRARASRFTSRAARSPPWSPGSGRGNDRNGHRHDELQQRCDCQPAGRRRARPRLHTLIADYEREVETLRRLALGRRTHTAARK
jgi:WS/DGAT C-terminal domain